MTAEVVIMNMSFQDYVAHYFEPSDFTIFLLLEVSGISFHRYSCSLLSINIITHRANSFLYVLIFIVLTINRKTVPTLTCKKCIGTMRSLW